MHSSKLKTHLLDKIRPNLKCLFINPFVFHVLFMDEMNYMMLQFLSSCLSLFQLLMSGKGFLHLEHFLCLHSMINYAEEESHKTHVFLHFI